MSDITKVIGSAPSFISLAKDSKLEALKKILNQFPNLDSMHSIDDLILRNSAKQHMIEEFPQEAKQLGFEVVQDKPIIKQAISRSSPVSESVPFMDTEGTRSIDISPFKKKITTVETNIPNVVGESVSKVAPSAEKMGLLGVAKAASKYLSPIGDIYNFLDPTMIADPSKFKEQDIPNQPGYVAKGDVILPKLNNLVKQDEEDDGSNQSQ